MSDFQTALLNARRLLQNTQKNEKIARLVEHNKAGQQLFIGRSVLGHEGPKERTGEREGGRGSQDEQTDATHSNEVLRGCKALAWVAEDRIPSLVVTAERPFTCLRSWTREHTFPYIGLIREDRGLHTQIPDPLTPTIHRREEGKRRGVTRHRLKQDNNTRFTN